MKIIITAVKFGRKSSDNIYFCISDKPYSFTSDVMVEKWEKYEIDRVSLEKGYARAGELRPLGKATTEEYRSALSGILDGYFAKQKKPKTIKELAESTKKMLPKLEVAARVLAEHIITGARVTVRFHNDCDGASGAIALYAAVEALKETLDLKELQVHWKMNRTVGYLMESYYEDNQPTESIENNLVFITDFGTSQESESAIDAGRGNDIIFVWLDHHPQYDGFDDYKKMLPNYINTWDFGGGSDYTAGYLTCVFAELVAPVETEHLRQASLISDFSIFGKRKDKKWQKVAVVLDYLTSKRESEGAVSPKSMSSIINDKERFEETFVRANTIMSEAIETGVNMVRHYKTKNDISVYVLDFRHIVRDDMEAPLPGRFSSRLQERMEELSGKRTVTIVHYGNYVSVRVEKDLADEIGMLKILEGLKNASEHVHSFGGHKAAASIKTDKEHIKHVVNLLLRELGAVT